MKKISMLLIFALIISTLSVAAYASDISFSVIYDASTELVTLRGNAKGVLTVRVTGAEVNPADLSDSNLPVDYHQFDSTGSFVDEFYLPQNTPYGKYNIYITNSVSSGMRTLVTYSGASADTTVKNTINSQTSSSGFVSAVVADAANLGIDINDEDFDTASLELMYNLGASYTNSADFYNDYMLCTAVNSMLNESNDVVLQKIEQYSSVLGINTEDDYTDNKNLTESAKSSLLGMISGMDYENDVEVSESITKEEDFKAVYYAYSALSAIKDTDSWQKIRDIYTSDFEFVKNNIVNKNSLYSSVQTSDVFAELATMNFESISDIKDNFDLAVQNVYYGNNKQNTSNGGGGGGGGWSAPSGSGVASGYDEAPGFKEKIKTELTTPVLSGAKASYTDIEENAWYFEAVSSLGGSGIISGDPSGAYRPNDNITRAEFAKLIVSAFDVKAEKSGFSDVAESSWYEPYVTVASGAGIIQGYEGKFNPDSFITRQDAAVIIYRTADLAGVAFTGYKEPSDIHSASVYAWPAIVTLYNNGVINGVGSDMFMPLNNISRAQAAQLIYNVIINIGSR